MCAEFLAVDLNRSEHLDAFARLLDLYMRDDMGVREKLSRTQCDLVIGALRKHSSYRGFFVRSGQSWVALANCFLNYSTFQARPLLNIHDLIVDPAVRHRGIGRFMLAGLTAYARENGFCRLNLEVRMDNLIAQALYREDGFSECQPPMFFWEKLI